jgi:hypothetical protein
MIGVYTLTAVAKIDANGRNIVPSATVYVKDETNTTPATIYSDASGTTTITQPGVCDANGNFTFYVEQGRYAITVDGVMKVDEVFGTTSQLVSVNRTASWTLDATMNGGFSEVTGSAAVVVTIPKESTTNLSLSGNRVYQHTIYYWGTGSLTIAGQDGTVTIKPCRNCELTMSSQYFCVTIMKSAHTSNLWFLVGTMDSAL